MSVLITIKFPVTAETMERVVDDHHDTMMAIIEDGRRQGAIHHQFTADPDGAAVVVDEWPDEETWQRFFAQQDDIKKVMSAAGVASEPTVTVYRILDTPDRF
jgi:hypothetical protein